MSYLERLRRRSLEKQALIGLTKPTKDPSVSSVSFRQDDLGTRASEKSALDGPTRPTESFVGSVGSQQGYFASPDLAERAAIIEWDGSAPTILAEALALMDARPWPAWCDTARWGSIVDSFARMIDNGAAAYALSLGWHLVELIGIQEGHPHGLPSRAGLVFSLQEGDLVSDVRPTHCRILSGRSSHLWLRIPLPADGSVLLPWVLRAT